MKGTQDHSEVDLSGRRNHGVQSRRGFWLFLGVVATLSTPAMAQIGDTLCACSPTVFNMTLDFSLTCADANIVSDGVVTTDCSITPFQGEVSSLVPVNVFSVDFLELDQDGQVLNQKSSFVDLEDGETVSYESFNINPDLVDELTAPKTLIVSFIARNSAREPLFMQYLITYSNSCDAYPVLFPGQQIGWTRFTILEDPSPAICSALGTFRPTPFTSSPSPSLPTLPPATPQPTFALVPTRPRPTRDPTPQPTPPPASPVSPAPTVTCVPRPSKAGKKGSKGGKGKGSKGGKGKGKGKYKMFTEEEDDHGKKLSNKGKDSNKGSKGGKGGKGKQEEDGFVYCEEPGSKSGKGKGKGKGVYIPPEMELHPTYKPTAAPTTRTKAPGTSSDNAPSADPPIDDDNSFFPRGIYNGVDNGGDQNVDTVPFGDYSSTPSSESTDNSSILSAMVWAGPLAAVSVVAAAMAAFLWSRNKKNADVAHLVLEKDGHSLATEECPTEVPHEIPVPKYHPKTRRAGSKV